MSLKVPTIYTAIDRYSGPVKAMSNNTASFAAKANANIARVDRAFRRVNKPLKSLNSNLLSTIGIAGGGFLIGQGMRSAVQNTIEFDDALAAASAKFGEFDRNSSVYQNLESSAREMGKTTRFTAGQSAEALKNMATAGFSAQQAIAGLPTVLDLAQATQSDLALASDLSAKSLAAFGLRSNDPKVLAANLKEVSGVFNKLITTSGFGNLEEFLTTIGRSGATAKSAGVDVQTWGTVVAATVSEAKDASTAGTEYSNVLTMLAQNQKKLKKLGVPVEDANGNYRDFLDILQDIEKQTAKMGQVQKAVKLGNIFGKRGAKTISILLGRGSEDLRKYRESLRNTGNITQQMAQFMQGSFGGLVASMESAFQEAGIAFIRNFQSEINSLINRVITFLREMGTWIKTHKEMLKTGVKVLLFLGKMFLLFKALQAILFVVKAAMFAYNVVLGIQSALIGASSIAMQANTVALGAQQFMLKAITAAQWLWNAAMAANPIGLIIIGIIALAAWITLLIKKWNSWGAAIALISGPLGLLLNIIQSFRRNWDLIKKGFTSGGILGGLKMIGATLIDAVLMPIQQILKLVSKIPGLGDLAGNAALEIENIRRRIGVNVTTDEEGKPLANATAAVESARIERLEKSERNTLDLNIKDPGNNSEFDLKQITLPGINITSTQGY